MPALHSFLSQARSPSTWPLDFTLTFSRALFLEVTLLSKLHPSLFVTSFHQQICSSISHLTNTLLLTPSPSSSDSILLLLSISKLWHTLAPHPHFTFFLQPSSVGCCLHLSTYLRKVTSDFQVSNPMETPLSLVCFIFVSI